MDEDIALIERYEKGDREAFNLLVLKHQKPLYGFLYRMVSDADDAADLLQKAFVQAFTGLSSFERRSSFKTWLYQIAVNLAKNLYRDRARKEQVPIDDVVIRREPKTLEGLIGRQHKEFLRAALAGLPEKQRLTLLLRIREEKKFEEIAGVMKCSVGTAKANYHHAVQKLKTMLAENGVAEGAAEPE